MTRTRYLTRYVLNLAAEALVWLSFGALSWTAVLDAETFVALIHHHHYALAVLVVIGCMGYVALTTIAIPTLHEMRAVLYGQRQMRIIREEQLSRCARLELLVQTPIGSDQDARKVLRMARTMPGGGVR